MQIQSLCQEVTPGGGHGYPFQYSRLGKPVDQGAWQAELHRVRHDWSNLACTHVLWFYISKEVIQISHRGLHTFEWELSHWKHTHACADLRAVINTPNTWKWKSFSRVRLFAAPWTIQLMEKSRPEYWSGYPFPSPGDPPNPGIKLRSPALQGDSLPAEPHPSFKLPCLTWFWRC